MKKFLFVIFLLILVGSLLYGGLGLRFYLVPGGSMEPRIKGGSLIVVVPTNAFAVGDVVSYKYRGLESHIVTHRIVEIRDVGDGKRIYITKGDNNEFVDKVPVVENEIVGKVFWGIPYAEKILRVVFSFWFLLLAFYIPVGFLVGREIKRIYANPIV